MRGLNCAKNKGLWILESSRSSDHTFSVLDGAAFLHLKLVCNKEVILDSQFLAKEQIVYVAKKSFAQFHLGH